MVKKDKVAIRISSRNWSFCKCYGNKMFHIGRTYTDVGGLGKEKGRKWGGRETGAMVSAAHTGVCCSAEQSLQGNPRSRYCLLKGAHGGSLTVAKKMEKRGQSWEMLGGGRERWVKGRRGATEDPRFLAWVPSRLSATYQDGDDKEAAAGPEWQGDGWGIASGTRYKGVPKTR